MMYVWDISNIDNILHVMMYVWGIIYIPHTHQEIYTIYYMYLWSISYIPHMQINMYIIYYTYTCNITAGDLSVNLVVI